MGKLKPYLKKKFILPMLMAVIVLVSASAVILLSQKNKPLATNENDALIGKVGKLIDLPKETPQIAIVSDITKLKGEKFFQKAVNGDRVLMYAGAKKAYLYRPSQDKLIEVAVFNPPVAQPSGTTQAPANINVALYNGTTTVGLTKKLETSLKTKYPNIAVVSKDNASKSDYTKTLVIDLTGKNKATVSTLAAYLGGEVGTLPEGEVKAANADLLIILGSQK